MPFFTGKPGEPLDFSLRLRDDGRYGLSQRYGYRDSVTGRMFFVPRFLDDFSTDGSSAPVVFSWLVPSIDAAAPASVLHDALVFSRKSRLEHIGPAVSRGEADRIFLTALQDLQIPVVRRYLMWAAVRMVTLLQSGFGRLAMTVAVLLALLWPMLAITTALTTGSALAALCAALVVAVSAIGIAAGGDRVRPLSIAVLAVPLLVPSVIIVMISSGVVRLSERAANAFVADRPARPAQVMVVDTIPAPSSAPIDGRVFVSYSHRDRREVEPWRDALADATGADVWWDNHLNAGDYWGPEILDELSRSDCVVVFWSKHAMTSEFIREVELKEALKRKVLIPALIDDSPLPDEIASTQAVKLHADPTLEEWNKLLRSVRAMLEAR